MRKQFSTASIVSGLTLPAGALLLKKAQGTSVRWMQDTETYLEPALLRSCIRHSEIHDKKCRRWGLLIWAAGSAWIFTVLLYLAL